MQTRSTTKKQQNEVKLPVDDTMCVVNNPDSLLLFEETNPVEIEIETENAQNWLCEYDKNNNCMVLHFGENNIYKLDFDDFCKVVNAEIYWYEDEKRNLFSILQNKKYYYLIDFVYKTPDDENKKMSYIIKNGDTFDLRRCNVTKIF
jgi:hypothetical protein